MFYKPEKRKSRGISYLLLFVLVAQLVLFPVTGAQGASSIYVTGIRPFMEHGCVAVKVSGVSGAAGAQGGASSFSATVDGKTVKVEETLFGSKMNTNYLLVVDVSNYYWVSRDKKYRKPCDTAVQDAMSNLLQKMNAADTVRVIWVANEVNRTSCMSVEEAKSALCGEGSDFISRRDVAYKEKTDSSQLYNGIAEAIKLVNSPESGDMAVFHHIVVLSDCNDLAMGGGTDLSVLKESLKSPVQISCVAFSNTAFTKLDPTAKNGRGNMWYLVDATKGVWGEINLASNVLKNNPSSNQAAAFGYAFGVALGSTAYLALDLTPHSGEYDVSPHPAELKISYPDSEPCVTHYYLDFSAAPTATPAPVSEYFINLDENGGLLSEAELSANFTSLQTWLQSTGWYSGEITGWWNAETQLAYLAMMEYNGMKSEGEDSFGNIVITKKQWDFLANGRVPIATPSASPTLTPTPTPTPTATPSPTPTPVDARELHLGQRDSDDEAGTYMRYIEKFQERLEALDFYEGLGVWEKGYYDDKTATAYVRFLEANGLRQDGEDGTVVTEDRYRLILNGAGFEALTPTPSPTPTPTPTPTLTPTPTPTPTKAIVDLEAGSGEKEKIEKLQARMNELGFVRGEDLTPGVYDEEMVSVMKRYYKFNGKDQEDGRFVTESEQEKIFGSMAKAYSEPERIELVFGDTDDAIEYEKPYIAELQKKLAEKKYLEAEYYPGVYDESLRAAVALFVKTTEYTEGGLDLSDGNRITEKLYADILDRNYKEYEEPKISTQDMIKSWLVTEITLFNTITLKAWIFVVIVLVLILFLLIGLVFLFHPRKSDDSTQPDGGSFQTYMSSGTADQTNAGVQMNVDGTTDEFPTSISFDIQGDNGSYQCSCSLKPVIVVGRGSDSDILLDSSDRAAHRHHCEIYQKNGQIRVRNLENHVTILNGRQIQDEELHDGDMLILSRQRMLTKL